MIEGVRDSIQSTAHGQECSLTSGEYSATIVCRGAALRTLSYKSRPLILSFDSFNSFNTDQQIPDYRGIIAAPWPNRLAGGRYEWDGKSYSVPINEPNRNTALHGLVSAELWTITELSEADVVLKYSLNASSAYPSDVEMVAHYSLDSEGLHVTVTATNTGPRSAPFGICPHPYLVAGSAPLDKWTLEVAAESYLEVSADRLLPLELSEVDGTDFDFREGAVLKGREIDHAFTNIFAEDGGLSTLLVSDPSGTFVGMNWDESCPWVQIHTADKADPSLSRHGLAVEPMTCPPDAFNSGTDVVKLYPGETFVTGWSIFGG